MSDLLQRSAARAARYKEEREAGIDAYWDQVVLSIDGNISTTPSWSGTDPYEANVTFRMNCEGTDGGTIFQEDKGHTFSTVGCSTNTSFKKFGNASILIAGGGGQSVRTTSSTDAMAFGSNEDFTIEFWFYPLAARSGTQIIGCDDSGAIQFGMDNWGKYRLTYEQFFTPPSTGQWHHMAVSRSSGTRRIFVDGVVVAQQSDTITYPGGPLVLGNMTDGNSDYGYIDDIRVTKGIARYTSTFLPPTESFGSHTNLSITDKKGHTITAVGNATVSTTQKMFGTGSLYFNGNSAYVDVADLNDFAYGTNDFTIEFWCWPLSVAGMPHLYDERPGGNGHHVLIYLDNGVVNFHANGTSRIAGSTISVNQWSHIAVCRSIGTTRLFVNGIKVGNDFADSYVYNSNSVRIGSDAITGSIAEFNGYIDDIRVTKGVSRYKSNDDLWNNVGFLMHMDGSDNGIVFPEETGKAVTVYGNAKTVTSEKKFGSSSAYFDGAGDYLGIGDHTGFYLAAGVPFTLEAWFYPLSVSSSGTIISKDNYGSNFSWCIHIQYAADQIMFATQNTAAMAYFPSASLGPSTINKWNHIAASHNGTTLKMFLNGNLLGESTIAVSDMYTNLITIGCMSWNNPGEFFNGYIDDIRITKGVARYTANFTPPTEAFPSINFTPPTRQNPDYGQLVDPYWNNVVLGLHMDGLDNGTVFHDEKGKTVTVYGNTKTVTSNKKFGISSAYFDGTGAYNLSLPQSSDFDFGYSDFTIECWVNPSNTNYQFVLGNDVNDANGYMMIGINVPVNGVQAVAVGRTTIAWPLQFGSGSNFPINTFTHLAICKSGTSNRCFINGVQLGATITDSTGWVFRLLCVGYQSGGSSITGYIDDLRITKGIARYTTNFTPPTRAFPRN